MLRSTDGQSQAVTKLAVLASVFEKLIAESGARRRRIEQLLAEIAEDRGETAAEESSKRAA